MTDMLTIELSDKAEIVFVAPSIYETHYTIKSINTQSGDIEYKQVPKEDMNRLIKFLVINL